MRNFPWVVRRNKNGEDTSPVLSRDCVQAQEVITVAFDGEANDEALAQAQHHIAHCSHCAHLWTQWESTRVLLRSVTAPPVPASLLTRILLACRLLPLQGTQQEAISDFSNRERLVQYLKATDDESLSASLNSILPPVPVPHDLHRKILQATAQTTPAPLFSLIAWLRQLVPSAPASRNAMRWGVGLAVPATLCWFVLSDNPAAVVEQAPDEVLAEYASSSSLSITQSEELKLKPLIKKAVEAVKKTPRMATAMAVPKSPALEEPLSSQPVKRRVINMGTAPSNRNNRVRIVLKSAPASSGVKTRVRNFPTKARPAPAIDMVENHTPSVVLVASQQSISRLPLQTAQKISHPSLAATPRLARLSETDFEEAFIAVTTARDNRPAEFSQAFDEYRAALLTEHSEVPDDMEEL